MISFVLNLRQCDVTDQHVSDKVTVILEGLAAKVAPEAGSGRRRVPGLLVLSSGFVRIC